MGFFEKVNKIVKIIPVGEVVSYGQIAHILDKPRSARQVGWALNALPKSKEKDVPWWRVVNSKGFLSIKNEDVLAKFRQKELLLREGIEVSEEFLVDLKKYQWGFTENLNRNLR